MSEADDRTQPIPIAVDRLVKHYRGRWWRRHTALAGISFRLERAQVLGLIGPNGGGKTTTFGCLLGLLRPSAGMVRVFGRAPTDPEARRRLGFVPESSPFPAPLSGRQGLAFYGRLAGLERRARRRRAEMLLERVGLREAANRRLGTYSKGMLRRFALAQALIAEPELLLLDEPASGLDPLGARDLGAVIEHERARGASVLIASHDLHALERMCDRFVLLYRGRVLLSGSREALLGGGRSLERLFFEAIAGAA